VPLGAGQHEGGFRSGRGVMLQPDGGWYTGLFTKGVFEGQGTYEYPDGSCFVGQWQDGKKHGPGVLLNALLAESLRFSVIIF
jgi:hypothetical protein